jgi:hypothetical protein
VPYELIRQLISAFSLTVCTISLVFFAYIVSKIRKLNPYLIFAVGTGKVVISQKLRKILILMFFSTFLFFTAYFVKNFLEIKILYLSLEVSSLLLFLAASFIGAVATLRSEENSSPGKRKNR